MEREERPVSRERADPAVLDSVIPIMVENKLFLWYILGYNNKICIIVMVGY